MMLSIPDWYVVSPASALNGRSYILFRDGKVAEIESDVRRSEGARKIDAA